MLYFYYSSIILSRLWASIGLLKRPIFMHSCLNSTNICSHIIRINTIADRGMRGVAGKGDSTCVHQSWSIHRLNTFRIYTATSCDLWNNVFSFSADVIEILQLQYKPFLLLAAQLQTIHEQVQVMCRQGGAVTWSCHSSMVIGLSSVQSVSIIL